MKTEVGKENKLAASARRDSTRSDLNNKITGRLPNGAHEGNQICYKFPQTTGFLSKVLTKREGRF